jgi:phosphate transport system protein
MQRGAREHSSREFETELRELTAHVLAMGARCERIVRQAFDGYRQGTPEVREQVVSIDAQIDQDEMDLHALVLRMLALRQPVAHDLRCLAATMRLITDLERVGDEAVNIAERAFREDSGAKRLAIEELSVMADAATDMLHLALQAFVSADDGHAGEVLARDEEVDQHCAHVMAAVTEWMSGHGEHARSGLRAIAVAKYLERIADHATNIAEQAIFLVRGADVRHGAWRQVEPAPSSQAAEGP